MATFRNPAPSHDHHGHGLFHHDGEDGHSDDEDMELVDPDSVPVEVLVEHLLAAKRALSSVTLVQRANDLTTHARQLHEESVVLDAQMAFLKRGISDQLRLLKRVQRSMIHTYDMSNRELRKLVKTNMDKRGEEMTQTMDKLKATPVDPVFRPPGEEPKNLFDFVSEDQVHQMFADLKDAIDQLHHWQDSFHEELQQFDSEMHELTVILSTASISPTNSADSAPGEHPSIMELLASLRDQSHSMADNLESLNIHFDACATAVSITEGGADLARRKAAEDSGEASAFSISGVMPAQDVDLEDPEAPSRAEAVTRVVRDAPQVDEVVADLHADLQQVEVEFSLLKDQSDRISAAYGAITKAFRHLEVIGSKLEGYVEAANSFVDHWNEEKEAIFDTLANMEHLRTHWEFYAKSYDSLILEVERRRVVEEKIQNIWRKAKAEVDKLVENDWAAREEMMADVGGYIPGDLWVGMSGPLQKWEVVRAQPGDDAIPAAGKTAQGGMPQQEQGSTARLDRDLIAGAIERSTNSKR